MRLPAIAVLALFATPAFAVPDDPSYPVMPDTPSGMGDPSNVVCRSAQRLPNGEMGPFSLSDAVVESGTAGFHVWRLNRWTGTQELCVSAAGQKGCSK